MHLSKLACDGLRTYTVRKRDDVVYEKPLDGPESRPDAITMAWALPAYTVTYEWTDEEVAAGASESVQAWTSGPLTAQDVRFDTAYLQKAIQAQIERSLEWSADLDRRFI